MELTLYSCFSPPMNSSHLPARSAVLSPLLRHVSSNTAFPRTTTIDTQFTMFNKVQDVSISGNAANVVHRDQYNGATTIHRIVRAERPGRTVAKKERKRHDTDSEYNQYREIIRGDIHKLEQIHEEEDGHFVQNSYRRTVHRVRVYGDDRVFTAISYHGRDAAKIWKKDFMKCSQVDDPMVLLQLFAINHSKVPILLFYDEWLPMGHLQSKAKGTFWEGYYLKVYTDAWQRKIKPTTYRSNLWLNPRTSHVSSGPDGPHTDRERITAPYNCEDMPSATEMANGDICVRFFNQTRAGNFDLDVFEYAYNQRSFIIVKSLLGIDTGCLDDEGHRAWTRRKYLWGDLWHCRQCDHTVYGEVQDIKAKLQFNNVYSGMQLEKVAFLQEGFSYTWETSSNVLSDRTPIDNGLTQFQFNVGFQGFDYVYFDTGVLGKAWLLQAHRPDLSTSGLETCLIPHLSVYLHIGSRPRQFSASALETLPIIYLFLRPSPSYLADIDSWSSRVSFWSFDENGTSEIPETERKRLGLPNIVADVTICLHRWPKYVYDALHAWQVARGFDPTTADFARSLGVPIFEPAITRFDKVVQEEEPSDPLPPPDSASDEIVAEKEETSSSSTSSWWSWTATPQSDFSVFAV